MSGLSIASRPARQNTAYVSDYGAVGDGITIDTDAIRNAIVAAGSYGTVVFSPGKTYLLDGELNPSWDGTTRTNQTWIGYGATLKRFAGEGIASVISETLVAGNTTCTVADTTGFRVGMSISFHTGTHASNAVYDTVNHRITNINQGTKVITFTPGVGTIYNNTSASSEAPGGSLATPVCYAVTKLIGAGAISSGLKIYGLKFDGNRVNNDSFVRWWNSMEVHLAADDCKIVDCALNDVPGEGVVAGGWHTEIRNNKITNTGGNGIHLGQTFGGCTKGNKIYNTNILTYVQHANGCIGISDQVQDHEISHNNLEGGLNAVGAIGAVANNNYTIIGNTIRNCVNLFDITSNSTTKTSFSINAGGIVTAQNADGTWTATATTTAAHGISAADISGNVKRFLEITGNVFAEKYFNGIHEILTAPTTTTLTFRLKMAGVTPVAASTGASTLYVNDDAPKNIVIANNRCYNSGKFLFENSGTFSSTLGANTTEITGNLFDECYGFFSRAHNVNLRGNTWKYYSEASVAVGSRTIPAVMLNNCTEVSIDDHVEGGLHGVQVSGTDSRNVKVGGIIRNPTKYGIFFNGTPTTAQNLSAVGATITCDADGAGYVDTNRWGAVRTEGGTIVTGCTIYANYGVAAAYNGAAIVCGTGNSGIETVITGNTIRVNQTANGGAPVVELSAGATGLIRYDQNWVGPVTAKTTGGATIAGTNVTIA